MTEVIGCSGESQVQFFEARDLIGDRSIADRHQIERIPLAGHVVGESLIDPQGNRTTHQRAGDDVELEDMSQLVNDELLELVRRLIDGQHHPIPHRFGEREDAFRNFAREEVGLRELGEGLIENQRNGKGDLVLELVRHPLVSALCIAHYPAQVLFELRVVIHLEVRRTVHVPGMVVVLDLVLAVVGPELRLLSPRGAGNQHEDQCRPADPSDTCHYVGHCLTSLHLPVDATTQQAKHRLRWLGRLPWNQIVVGHFRRIRVPRNVWGLRILRKLGSKRSISSK